MVVPLAPLLHALKTLKPPVIIAILLGILVAVYFLGGALCRVGSSILPVRGQGAGAKRNKFVLTVSVADGGSLGGAGSGARSDPREGARGLADPRYRNFLEACAKLATVRLDMYVVETCSEAGETSLKAAYAENPLVRKLVPEHKRLFAGTRAGRVSMIRQLQPHLHLDHEQDSVAELQGKIRLALLMNAETAEVSLADEVVAAFETKKD